MGSSLSVEEEMRRSEQRGELEYQIAMSNRIFSDNIAVSDLPCMNCLRVEMGERACYTGICDACGKTPPCLQWMYPELQPSSQARSSSHNARRVRRRSTQLALNTAAAGTRRRASISSQVSTSPGLAPDRIDKSSFTHTFARVVGVDSEGSDKDSTQCVICLGEFRTGDRVRRLACLHLFHVSCVDTWFVRNRVCPVCRVDIEASAAQFR